MLSPATKAGMESQKTQIVPGSTLVPLGKGWGLTKNIPSPNIYVKMLPEYQDWIFLDEDARKLKGLWKDVFPQSQQPLDLEIGCGNGFFFEQEARAFPERNILGIELKYKPLVQTVRRVRNAGFTNARGIRYHARYIDSLFAPKELSNIFIYFPDPWPRKRQHKNRLVRTEFLEVLKTLQKPGCWVDFKTDSKDYFEFAEGEGKNSSYKIIRHSLDLHKSEWAAENFVTSFERIFLRKGQPIYYMRFENHQ